MKSEDHFAKYIFSFESFNMVPFNPDSEADFSDYKIIVMDEEIMQTVSLFNCSVPSEEEAKKSYEKLTEINKISDIPLSYKIMTKDSDIMGFIMPAILKKDQDGNAVVLDFGGLFRQKYRGSTALMASSIIEKQCFNVRTIDKLVASALSDNYNPQAIFLRLGFEYAGQTKKSDDGKAINVFELTRKKFSFPDFKPARIKGIKEYIDKMPEMLPSSSDFIKPFCLEA